MKNKQKKQHNNKDKAKKLNAANGVRARSHWNREFHLQSQNIFRVLICC